ncbi:ADP-ribosylglycohydrolase [Chryseolinea serpens]|uniref:ADP-ribosylglycohydrolase n=1 Tax=Chryseolinea serpens TaxID=947013 RepID=A0A1M5P506_9BACT|nr:ADP-ribosylglycohydrolase family protein [Chryseolinea serpens]SHG96876.1 ADP-ribosylglycohydrolase [Chryseolinea serpens]
MSLREKLKGCLVLGAIGDSIGSRFEGNGPVEKVSYDFHWSVSDDTQLTLATCEAIYASEKVMPELVAMKFLEWFNRRKLTGLGSSTLKALRELQVGGHWALVGNTGERAAGNGAAMRIAPLAFKRNMSRTTIKDVCSITHKNDEAYTGGLAIYYSIRNALDGGWKGGQDLIEKIVDELPDTNVRDRLMELQELKQLSLVEIGQRFKPTGYVVDSVPVSVFAAQQIGKLGADQIFQELVKMGGDTDTTCSMTGQIIGTLLGYNEIPMEWMEKYNSDLRVKESVDLFVEGWRE